MNDAHAPVHSIGAVADPAALRDRLRRWQRLALIAGVVGVVLCLIGVFVSTRQAAFSYLFRYLLCTGFGLVSLAL